MQVSVESPTKLQRRLTITVPEAQLDTAFDERIAKLAKTAKIKGFRPGNVPVNHIKRMYGEAARKEALSDVIQSSLYTALSQEKLTPVSMPNVEPKTIEPGKPLEFVATFEVLPEIGNVEFNVDTIEKFEGTVNDEDINKVISKLCEQHTQWNEVTRAAKENDQVILDFRGSIDGKHFEGGEAHDYPIIIGSKTMIPGFEEGIIGIQKGEEKTITVTFPDNYFAKEYAGKNAEFHIHAHKISEPSKPEMDAAMIKKFGVQSGELADLKSEIKKNLEREVDRIIASKTKNQIFEILIQQNPLELPEAMIMQEAERIHHEMHPHHGKEGHNHSKEEMTPFIEAAKKNVAIGLLVSEYVKQNAITPDTDRVHAHIKKMSAAYESPEEVIKWYNADKRRLAEIEMLILEEQVIEKLTAKAASTPKTVSYSELVNS